MTATFFFVRHGANDLIESHIAGRTPGLRLNERGRAQARQVADALGHLSIDAVFAGPLERAFETAEPLCTRLQLPLQTAGEFNEVDFGEWNNQPLSSLDEIPEWQHWNALRSASAAPKGETMLEVQGRVVRKMIELRTRYQQVVIFTHGDVIRATVAHFLGTPLDLFLRIQIDAGSISVVELGEDFTRVRLLNAPPDAPVRLGRG